MPLKMEQYEKSLAQPPLCEQLKVRDLPDNLLDPAQWVIRGRIPGERYSLLLRQR